MTISNPDLEPVDAGNANARGSADVLRHVKNPLGHAAEQPETYIVAVPDMAGRLVGKRLDARFYESHGHDGVRTCDVVFGWGIGHELLDGFE